MHRLDGVSRLNVSNYFRMGQKYKQKRPSEDSLFEVHNVFEC